MFRLDIRLAAFVLNAFRPWITPPIMFSSNPEDDHAAARLLADILSARFFTAIFENSNSRPVVMTENCLNEYPPAHIFSAKGLNLPSSEKARLQATLEC
ncbi:unnamed protein product [Fusarium graminearum]|uniref:Uncharacterized protein n=1 Tax=Gibberella zeae TaxID=5518 RepID=A0A4E9E661_GIBZA|nr:unnamed protein product [Fusarium graminearum]